MRQTISFIAVVLSLPFLICSPRMASAQESPLAAVAWLAGCWAAETAEAGSVEQWLPPAGGGMLGVARTVKNGKTVSHEFLQIRSNAEGKLVYIALPSGQKEATFTAVNVGEGSVTFENLQHDFPQRILYKALPGDKLAARIEGLRGGVLRGIDYPMKRVSCDVPARSTATQVAAPAAVPANTAPAAQTPTSPTQADLRQAVMATERAFAKTMADRDLAAFATFIANETVFFSGPKPLHGKQQVVDFWAKFYTKPLAPFSWEPEEVEVLSGGNLALSAGPVHGPDGKLIARFTSIWRRTPANTWEIIFDKGGDVCDCKTP